jgi:hypothetical protein
MLFTLFSRISFPIFLLRNETSMLAGISPLSHLFVTIREAALDGPKPAFSVKPEGGSGFSLRDLFLESVGFAGLQFVCGPVAVASDASWPVGACLQAILGPDRQRAS